MISKVVDQLVTDLVNTLAEYNCHVSAMYTPELPGIMRYSRDFLSTLLSTAPTNINKSKYQNRLMYRVGTPKLSEFKAHNQFLSSINGFEKASQAYTMSSTSDTIVKTRVYDTSNPDEGKIIKRDVSLLDLPIEFALITESKDLVFEISLLFYQVLVKLTGFEVTLNLNNDENDLENLEYFCLWNTESLEIEYANFDSDSTLNTLQFNVKITGGFFSGYYKEDYIINSFNLRIGGMNDQV